MQKWHRGHDGEPKRCVAVHRCALGGEHFDSYQEAQKFLEDVEASKHELFSTNSRRALTATKNSEDLIKADRVVNVKRGREPELVRNRAPRNENLNKVRRAPFRHVTGRTAEVSKNTVNKVKENFGEFLSDTHKRIAFEDNMRKTLKLFKVSTISYQTGMTIQINGMSVN